LGFIWQDNIFENCRVVASYKYKKIAAFNLMNGELEENEGIFFRKKKKKSLDF
jgi:hypothetical protein